MPHPSPGCLIWEPAAPARVVPRMSHAGLILRGVQRSFGKIDVLRGLAVPMAKGSLPDFKPRMWCA